MDSLDALPLRIAVIGVGYLGATHAACMAELGHDVIGLDVDESKLAVLAGGRLPFYEPGLGEVLERNISAGRLRFTSSYDEAVSFADVFFVCVGTPQKAGEFSADLRFVDSAFDALASRITRPAVIFGKSTVPVGTADRLRKRVSSLSPAGDALEVSWNPEFLREGFAVEDTLNPDRLVIGVREYGDGDGGYSEAVARAIYSRSLAAGVPFIVTDFATAELVKVSANAFLATKISFINAVSEICDAVGANVATLADALGHDARIGRRFLNAGIGFGGGCLPKDIRAFMARAGELGADQALALLREVDNINVRSRMRMVELAKSSCGSFMDARVAVLGAAFKPDSDDVRDSPALYVAGQIQLQGATVTVYDPKAMENCRSLFPTLQYCKSALEACDGADAILVLTEWTEFSSLRPEDVGPIVRSKVILDGRNCLDPDVWRDAGWTYRSVGRP